MLPNSHFSSSSSCAATCRSIVFALFPVVALVIQIGVVHGQETTLTEEGNDQVVTTSISPTVYTTDGAVFTFEPTAPSATLAPISTGSVVQIQDYITTVSSGAGDEGAATGMVGMNFKQNAVSSAAGASARGAKRVAVAALTGVVAVVAIGGSWLL